MNFLKRFLIITLLLVCLPINSAAAAPSRQLNNLITLEPNYAYIMAEDCDEWPQLITRLEQYDGYVMLDALKINYDKICNNLFVKLSKLLTTEDEPFVLIINTESIAQQEIGFDEEGRACVDLSEYELGEYWLCFYIKEE